MGTNITELQNSIIKEIATKEGFYKYELEVTSGSEKGDGSLGIINRVTIKDSKRSLHLIMKSAHTSQKLREKTSITKAYSKEIFVYNTVFPTFATLEKEYNVVEGFSGYAKIYGSSMEENDECLILENLKELDYSLSNKSVPMNSEHLAAVFKEYGKFHAISLVMNNKKPEVYTRLANKIKDKFDFNNDGSKNRPWESLFGRVLKAGLEAVQSNHAAVEAMQRFSKNMDNLFHELEELKEDETVILHGDCWNNNMMFKYEDPLHTTKPKNVCFIDWQMSRIGSPVLDLAYFFFVCGSKGDLSQYNKYLKIYYNSLSEMLSKFSCDAEIIFPFDILESHWRKFSKFGLLLGIMLIKVMLSERDEIPDLEDAAETYDHIIESMFINSIHSKVYEQRIIDIVTIMSDNELI